MSDTYLSGNVFVWCFENPLAHLLSGPTTSELFVGISWLCSVQSEKTPKSSQSH